MKYGHIVAKKWTEMVVKRPFIILFHFRTVYNTGPKWQRSTQQASSMYQMHGTSLLSTPLPFWTSSITLGKKIDDEKTLLLKIIWL